MTTGPDPNSNEGRASRGERDPFVPVTDSHQQRALWRGRTRPGHSYLLHIEDLDGDAWRRLRVPSVIGMERLARTLQIALDVHDPAEHAFIQHLTSAGDEYQADPLIMPVTTLVRFDAAGTPSETVTLGEVLPAVVDAAGAGNPGEARGLELHFLMDFGHPSRARISLVTDSARQPTPETLCVDGAGAFAGSMGLNLAAINRELDAERWVFAKISRTKAGLKDLIFRTGMWELAQLIAYLDIKTPPRVSDAAATDMVAPLLDALAYPGAANLKILGALNLVDTVTGQLTALGSRLQDDPVALWHHVTHHLPLERDTRGNDAAWLTLISLISAMPFGTSTTFVVESLAWAGHRNGEAGYFTVADVENMASLTLEVLRLLGVIDGSTLVLGGRLSRARREFLRAVLRDPVAGADGDADLSE